MIIGVEGGRSVLLVRVKGRDAGQRGLFGMAVAVAVWVWIIFFFPVGAICFVQYIRIRVRERCCLRTRVF